jgi:hypothetical protein
MTAKSLKRMKKHFRVKEEARILRLKSRMQLEEDDSLDELKEEDADQDITNRGQGVTQ